MERDEPREDGPRSRWWQRPLPWIVALVVVVLVAGAGAFVLLKRSDEAGAEVILQPTSASGEDPFTDSVATQEVDVEGGEVEQVAGGGASVEAVKGSSPELYGGTGDEEVCDREQLAEFLEDNPAKGRAFAEVVGVPQSGLRVYVEGLTPVVLREDTRVTNHGFENGRAKPYQAVLQAGTAVLVDDRGVPRVRCACGNPLAEPAAVKAAPEYRGRRWRSFDEERLVAVSAADRRIDRFKLVNVETGEPYEEPAGGASEIVIGSDGFPESVGPWDVEADGPAVEDAAEALGIEVGDGELDQERQACVYEDAGVELLAEAPAVGSGEPCAAGAEVGSLRIESDAYETEEGLRVGMSEGEISDLHPDATEVDAIAASEGFGPGEKVFSLATAEDSAGGSPFTTLAALTEDGEVIAFEIKPQAAEVEPGVRGPLTVDGLEPIKLGMTVEDVEAATGETLEESPGGFCREVVEGVSVQLANETVSAVIVAEPEFPTESGVRVGDPFTRLEEVYGSRLEVLNEDPAAVGQGPDAIVRVGDYGIAFWTFEGLIQQMVAGSADDLAITEELCA